LAINSGLISNKITCLQSSDSFLFAGTKNNGLFKSINQGVNWQQVSNGLPSEANIRCIYNYDSILFVGTGVGEVFASNDYGNTWHLIETGLTGGAVLSLSVFEGYLYAGMNASGVWKYPLSVILGTDDIEVKADFYIYPNPSNNSITLVTNKMYFNSYISVHSIIGQKLIRKKVKENITHVDISTLASGIYLVEYERGNGSVSKKRIIKL